MNDEKLVSLTDVIKLFESRKEEIESHFGGDIEELNASRLSSRIKELDYLIYIINNGYFDE
jgi:hypothetical protein